MNCNFCGILLCFYLNNAKLNAKLSFLIQLCVFLNDNQLMFNESTYEIISILIRRITIELNEEKYNDLLLILS